MTPADRELVEGNLAVGRRFFEEQDRLRGGPAGALCAADYRAVIGGSPPMDRAGHEGFAHGFYAGFPDAMHAFDEIIATDDAVVVRFTLSGTHTGSFFGLPPTGRPIVVTAIAVLRVVGGRVTTLNALFDEAGLLRQLGVLPAN